MSPRFNHVAMSVPPALLDDHHRADLIDFHRTVFGWDEMPTMTKPGEQLILQAYEYDQFVFLIADDEPMRCPRLDHFGMAVDSKEEFDSLVERARERAAADDRVDLIEPQVETYGDYLELHNFYVGFLLPMMVEVQFFEWAPSADGSGAPSGADGERDRT